jgi:hypothetical protein
MFDIYAPVPFIFFPTMSSAIEPQVPNQGNLLRGAVICSGKAQNCQIVVFSSKNAILNHFGSFETVLLIREQMYSN